ncbi:MAG: ferritin-like domain-containing protein [Acidobacteriota bacterium]|nr:ferritin-like domain-containing protein [Acidobacteriota bacterium]
MDNNLPLLESVEPDYINEMTARREPIEKARAMTGAIAATTILSFGALAGAAYGKDKKLPGKIVDVLNFALTLEYLEDEFYRTALGSGGLIPRDTQGVFGQISKHETAHVRLLSSVLGSQAVRKPNFDFTAGGAFADVFSNYQTFLAVSQAFEDTGVRAYKGQAGNLKSNDKILTTALQIHSVEARHAAMVRRLRGESPWIVGDSRGTLPAATQPVYNGEGNTTQGAVNVASLPGVSTDNATKAFDEPLSKAEVLAIAGLFIRK